jgi:lipopolysaccharide export system protein LptC
MRRRFKALLSLCASLLVLLYWGFSEPEKIYRSQAPALLSEVDAYMLDAEILEFNAEGRLQQQLVAERIEHLPDTDQTLLTIPSMKILRPGNPAVHIQAMRGTVDSRRNLITLQQEVVVKQNGSSHYRLETSTLSLWPEKEYAETQSPVVISNASGIIKATGLKAYLADGRIKLLSNVRGTYVTQ